MRKWASSSATSIDTEENSLGVPKAQSRVLIYMRDSQNMTNTMEYKYKGNASWLSKYSYRNGDGHQEVSESR